MPALISMTSVLVQVTSGAPFVLHIPNLASTVSHMVSLFHRSTVVSTTQSSNVTYVSSMLHFQLIRATNTSSYLILVTFTFGLIHLMLLLHICCDIHIHLHSQLSNAFYQLTASHVLTPSINFVKLVSVFLTIVLSSPVNRIMKFTYCSMVFAYLAFVCLHLLTPFRPFMMMLNMPVSLLFLL